ncbi:MAG: hypothetical protein ACXVAY_01100 [Mucilaginibacter sp.]
MSKKNLTNAIVFKGRRPKAKKNDEFRIDALKIPRDVAQQLIQGFQQQNGQSGTSASSPSQIVTETGIPLKGFFIDRNSLDSILADAAYVGLSVYIAKHPDHQHSNDMVYTIVFAGAKPNPAWIAGSSTTTEYLNDGDIYEYVDPCPTACGDLGN